MKCGLIGLFLDMIWSTKFYATIMIPTLYDTKERDFYVGNQNVANN